MSAHAAVRLGIVIYDGADELDVVGPLAVLSSLAGQTRERVDVLLASFDGAPVRSSGGLDLVPNTDFAELAHVHVLIHPGGPGAARLASTPATLSALRSLRRTVPLFAAIDSAAVPLACAGLLAGRAVTIHPRHRSALLAAEPSALVDTTTNQLDDGDLITCAASGHAVELALHVVERLFGPEASIRARSSMHFEPISQPPTAPPLTPESE